MADSVSRIEVKGCYDCPFAHLDNKKWICGHPDGEKVVPITRYGRLAYIPAFDCPLKKEIILISLKER